MARLLSAAPVLLPLLLLLAYVHTAAGNPIEHNLGNEIEEIRAKYATSVFDTRANATSTRAKWLEQQRAILKNSQHDSTEHHTMAPHPDIRMLERAPADLSSQGEIMGLIAVVKNRPLQYAVFVEAMSTYLRMIGVRHQILVVEAENNTQSFNRARMFNAGVAEMLGSSLEAPSYFCFHDVDHIPAQPDIVDYGYPGPMVAVHVSERVQAYGWKLVYKEIMGGILCMSRGAFEAVNGFSNNFWGWGGEDDEMFARLTSAKIEIKKAREGYFWSMHTDHTPRDCTYYQDNANLASISAAFPREGYAQVHSLYSVMYESFDERHRHVVVWLHDQDHSTSHYRNDAMMLAEGHCKRLFS